MKTGDEFVRDNRFVRGWLNIKELPGGMMSGPKGPFGPVPATTSCIVTTSESVVNVWRNHGDPFIEVWVKAEK